MSDVYFNIGFKNIGPIVLLLEIVHTTLNIFEGGVRIFETYVGFQNPKCTDVSVLVKPSFICEESDFNWLGPIYMLFVQNLLLTILIRHARSVCFNSWITITLLRVKL